MARERGGRFIVLDIDPMHFEQQFDRVADRIVVIDDKDLGAGFRKMRVYELELNPRRHAVR